MSDDFDIVPPTAPEDFTTDNKPKKQSLFQKLFSKHELVEPDLSKNTDDFTKEHVVDVTPSTNYATEEAVDKETFHVDAIRSKLGLDDDKKTTDHLYDQLDKAAKEDDLGDVYDKEQQDNSPDEEVIDNKPAEQKPLKEKLVEKKTEPVVEEKIIKKPKDNHSFDFTKEEPSVDTTPSDFTQEPEVETEAKSETDKDSFWANDEVAEKYLSEPAEKTSLFTIFKNKKKEPVVDTEKESLVDTDIDLTEDNAFEKEEEGFVDDYTEDLTQEEPVATARLENKPKSQPKINVRPIDKMLQDITDEAIHVGTALTTAAQGKKPSLPQSDYISINKTQLKRFDDLKQFGKKSKYPAFKKDVLRNEKTFSSWVKGILKTQRETEKVLRDQLQSTVSSMISDFENHIQSVVREATPIKKEEFVNFKTAQKKLAKKQKEFEKHEKTLEKMQAAAEKVHASHALLLDKLEKQKDALAQEYKNLHQTIEDKVQEHKNKLDQDFAAKKSAFDKTKSEFETHTKLLKDKLEEKRKKLHAEYQAKVDQFAKWSKQEANMLKTDRALLEQEVKRRELEFESKKKRFKHFRDQTEKELHHLKKQTEIEKRRIEHEHEQVHNTIKKLTQQKEIFSKEKDAIEKQLKKREDAVIDATDRNEELLRVIQKKQEELQDLEHDVEDKGFETYLKARLEKPSLVGDEEPTAFLNINDMIQGCRKLVEQNSFGTAKREYNKIRQAYEFMDLNSEERSMMYTKIRELYDDINLKIIEENTIR